MNAGRPSITPEMIAAGADVLEHVHGIGRWLAESLTSSVLEAAFETQERAPQPGAHFYVMPSHVRGIGYANSTHGNVACGHVGCCTTRCRFC